jgi:prevent-host-death family protein
MKRSQSEIVSIAHLKAKLAYYLRKVRSGEEIVITEHKRPIAKLVQLDPSEGMEVKRAKGSFAEVAGKKLEPLESPKSINSLSHLVKERGNR